MKQLSNKKLRQYLTWLQANEVKMDKLAHKIRINDQDNYIATMSKEYVDYYLSDESKYTTLHNKRMKYLVPLLDYVETEATLLIEGPQYNVTIDHFDGVCITKSGLEYYLNLVAHPISFLLLEGWFNLRFKNNLEILELVFPKQRTSSHDIVVRIDMTWLNRD